MQTELTDMQVANVKMAAAEKAYMQVANVKMAAAEKAYNAGLITWAEYLAVNAEFHETCDQQRHQGGAL